MCDQKKLVPCLSGAYIEWENTEDEMINSMKFNLCKHLKAGISNSE